MHPVLFTLGPVTVYTFGLFAFLAFFVAVFTIWFFGRRENFEEEKILDAVLTASVVGLLGGRFSWFLGHPHVFVFSNFFRFFKAPGFTFLGAVLTGLIGLFWFCGRVRWNFLKFLDIAVLGLALGEGIGRIGCFLSGTAFGRPTGLFWGVFQVGLVEKRHPVQILEALFTFLIFYILLQFKAKHRFAGFLAVLYFFCLGVEKFLLEFLRQEGIYWGKLKAAQVFSFFGATLSGIWLYRRMGKGPRQDLENLVSLILFWLGRGVENLKKLWSNFQNWTNHLLRR